MGEARKGFEAIDGQLQKTIVEIGLRREETAMKAAEAAEAVARKEEANKTIVALNMELQQLHRELKMEKIKQNTKQDATNQAELNLKTIVDLWSQLMEMKVQQAQNWDEAGAWTKSEMTIVKLQRKLIESQKQKEQLHQTIVIVQAEKEKVSKAITLLQEKLSTSQKEVKAAQ